VTAAIFDAIIRRTAHVAVVCEAGVSRHELVATLRQLGFDHVAPLSTVQDFINFSNSRPVEWVICTLMADRDQNAIDLLRYILDRGLHNRIKVSLLCDPGETAVLPTSFEFGLFSWHERDFHRGRLQASLTEMTQILRSTAQDGVLTSAHFLRKHLLSSGRTALAVALEQSLIDHYPGKPGLLLQLARGLLENGQVDDALTAISQAVFLDPSLEVASRNLYQEFKRKRPGMSLVAKKGFGGVASCMIVDPDIAATNQISSMIRELGIQNIAVFADGEAAWQHIKDKGAPDLLLAEWRLPTLSGLGLIQRLRANPKYQTAVVLVTSLLKRDDKPLLSEMLVANLISKPVDRREFLLAIRWTLTQERRPTEQLALERAIFSRLAAGDQLGAGRLRSGYMANKKISNGRKIFMRAMFSFYKQNYKQAKEQVIEAIRASGSEPLAAINLLGKILLKLGDHRAALKCFERASAMSPHNIQRICDIADIYLEQGLPGAATEALRQAHAIDGRNGRILSTQAKASLSEPSRGERAKSLMAVVEDRAEIIRYSNNRAVALIHENKLDEATDLYRTTLTSLPDSDTDLRAIVAYNLGLAFCRSQSLAEAAAALEIAARQSNAPTSIRARSLLARVRDAIANNKPVVLRLGNKKSAEDDFEFESIGPKVDQADSLDVDTIIKPGEACLHGIFRNTEELDEFTLKLLSKGRQSA
jgi:tetratricopeptide (TPR) repeat protein